MEPIVIWDLDDDPFGNVTHIAEHGISKEEVESVLLDPQNYTDENRGKGDWITFGTTYSGKYIAVIWDEACDDPEMVYPVTAYEVEER
jgi:Domain of unknown function (DUF4258)